ncbi:MAG TPA: tyrosine--tRNA ligase [Firmicutes bacterium]|nr:tyrosine--tRNA ligase [Bacillota bacterium]
MNIIDELKYRGLIKDFSNEEEVRKLLDEPQTIYCGFDPSASSMHLGNFVMISMLMRLQRAGHRIIALVGGGTGMIGDPSGKSKERNLLNADSVGKNTAAIKEQLERFIDLTHPEKGMIVNNYDWLSKLNLLDYLRDYGKYFPINYMLSKDIVASRLQSGISYTEFSYTILQSIDFLHLFLNENCKIQIGGGDQWGNLTSGLELIRKTQGVDTKAGCFTVPLLLDSQGKKFGKSEGGALYLDPKLVSPYKLYQFLFNSGDDDAARYLKIFSFKSIEEIESIIKDHYEHLGQRIAQKALAYEVTSIIHGEDKAKEAVNMSSALFSGDIKSLSKENIIELLGNMEVNVSEGLLLEDLLIAIKAASSKREAREFIKGNSVSINGDKVNDLEKHITKEDALFNEFVIVKRGKKNYYLVKFN